MKLNPKAAVYWRVYLLLKNSQKFIDTLRQNHKPTVKAVDEICEQFLLAEDANELEWAQELVKFLMTDDNWIEYCTAHGEQTENIKVSNEYNPEDETITLKIHAPLSKEEFVSMWEEIKNQQILFLDSKQLPKTLLPLGKKPMKLNHFKEEIKRLVNKTGSKPEHILEELMWVGKSKHPWKFGMKMPSIDADLEIYRIQRKYKSFALAERHYKKIMLEKYLLDTKKIKIKFDDSFEFADALDKYFPEFQKLNDKQIQKRVGYKDFKTRIEEMRQHWSV